MMNTIDKKQPPILIVAFFTEMWERYGFYVIQGILVLFMTSQFHFSDDHSYNILGAFTAFAYITPIAGGMLANRILGFNHSILLGTILLAAGYMILAIPSPVTFYLGLSFVAMGNGFFKPNVACYLGTFYNEQDLRRDQGFSIFYAGMNLGSLLTFLSSGYIAEFFGWNMTFVIAGIGLIIGALTFGFGTCYLHKTKRLKQIQLQSNAPAVNFSKIIQVYIGIVIGIIFIYFIIHYETLANYVLSIGILLLIIFIGYSLHKSEKFYRKHIFVCVALIIFSILFWALYFQMFFSATLFIDRLIDHNLFGVTIPTQVFFGMESLGIIVFGFLLGLLWKRLELRHKDLSHPMKFAISFWFLALTFLAFIASAHFITDTQLGSAVWVLIAMLFFSLGELCLSPIGLSAITMLAPPKIVGLMMGTWLISLGIGGKLASLLAHLAAVNPAQDTGAASIKHIYTHTFWIFIIIAIVVSFIALALTPLIKRLTVDGNLSKDQHEQANA